MKSKHEMAEEYASTEEWKSNRTAPFVMAQSDLFKEKVLAYLAGFDAGVERERNKMYANYSIDQVKKLQSALDLAVEGLSSVKDLGAGSRSGAMCITTDKLRSIAKEALTRIEQIRNAK